MNVLTNCIGKLATATLLASLLPWSTIQAATDVDIITAVVNNDVIMQSELDTKMSELRAKYQRQNTALPEPSIFQTQVLEQLIIELLQLQEADQLGVQVSDTMLNNAMANIAKNNNLSLPQLHEAIVKSGQTVANFRAEVQRSMIIDEVSKIAVKRRINVSEKEIDQFLESQQGQELADTEYLLSHILIATPAQATQQQIDAAKSKLAALQAEIDSGADFTSLASKYSDANNALEGGNLGWRKVSQLPALFAAPVAKLAVDEVSPALSNASGYHLVKVMQKRGIATQQIEQTKANHILVLSNEIRSVEDTKALVDDIYSRLQQGTEFYKLARSFSDDANTALKGGDMGWLNPGQLPKYMQGQLDALAAQEISAPFKGAKGWHILQVVQRQTKDVGQNILRNKARTALHDGKFAGELENWLRELRNQSYVEIR